MQNLPAFFAAAVTVTGCSSLVLKQLVVVSLFSFAISQPRAACGYQVKTNSVAG